MNAHEILLRIRSNFQLKVLLGIVLTTAVWSGYLFLQRHPLFPAAPVRSVWLDHSLPFMPAAVYPYESIWLFMPIAPWLMTRRENLIDYSRGIALIAFVAFAIFLFHPTSCPRPGNIPDAGGLYGALIQIDGERNAWPSLHVAFAIFHGAWCFSLFSAEPWPGTLRWGLWAWALIIIASTLLTKQHVLFDVAAGGLLGWGGFVLTARRRNRPADAAPDSHLQNASFSETTKQP